MNQLDDKLKYELLQFYKKFNISFLLLEKNSTYNFVSAIATESIPAVIFEITIIRDYFSLKAAGGRVVVFQKITLFLCDFLIFS